MTPAHMVGTDMLFGLVLAIIGSTVHWALGSISAPVLVRFAVGGVPGVVLGCLLAPVVPARKLKAAMATIAIVAGPQLAWSGTHALATPSAPSDRIDRIAPRYSRGTVDRIGIVTGPDPSTPITTWQLPSTIAPGSTIRHGVSISALTIAFA